MFEEISVSNGIEPGTARPAGQRLNRRAVGLLIARAVSRKSNSLLWTWFRWEIVSKAPDWSVGSEPGKFHVKQHMAQVLSLSVYISTGGCSLRRCGVFTEFSPPLYC